MSFLSKIFGCKCKKDCKCAPSEKCNCGDKTPAEAPKVETPAQPAPAPQNPQA